MSLKEKSPEHERLWDILEESRKDFMLSKIELEIDDELDLPAKLSLQHGINTIKVSSKVFGSADENVRGIFDHHLNALIHLGGSKQVLLENSYLDEVVAKENIEDVRNYFDDIVIALDLVVNKNLFNIASTYREIIPDNGLNAVLKAYLSEMTGLDFGKTIEDLSVDQQRKWHVLEKIPFLDVNKLKDNLQIFGRSFQDVKNPPLTSILIEDFSPESLDRSLKELPRELEFQEYRKLIFRLPEWLTGEYQRVEKGGARKKIRQVLKNFFGKGEQEEPEYKTLISKGRPKREIPRTVKDPILTYYKSLSKSISPRFYPEFREEETGIFYPSGLTDFKEGDSIDDWRPLESYLRLAPGLAKKWEKKKLKREGTKLSDLMIIVDSSGSMPDPQAELSYPVLGACCVAENYLKEKKKVGVINFSDKNLFLFPSRNEREIYNTILTYQGGGTTLQVEEFEKVLEKVKTEADIKQYLIVTDAGIENFEAFKEVLQETPGERVLLWHKKSIEKKWGKVYKEMYTDLKENLGGTAYEIGKKKDIHQIRIGRQEHQNE